ncbi:hypothetical protein I5770_02975 [Brucella sp. BO2]|uniref:hypothetical protein n=1 Tax=Brucella sp. BO2 TaxID=693750 RepID=UPI0018C92865|nr:hypothetical protein [Brucella sp. BO2]QPN27621.1 hypothetical protein I5770_02975 [Brucella sp. BO2]
MNAHTSISGSAAFDPNSWHHSQMTIREAIDLSQSGGHSYSSPNVPKGFNTVVGFFFDCYDWYPAAYDDEEGNAMKDRELIRYGEWCDKYARKLGLEVKEVEAPAALKVHGIMTLKAYPEALLEIRCTEVP